MPCGANTLAQKEPKRFPDPPVPKHFWQTVVDDAPGLFPDRLWGANFDMTVRVSGDRERKVQRGLMDNLPLHRHLYVMDAWMRDIPPIARSWVFLCILTTIAVVRTFSSSVGYDSCCGGSSEISPVDADLAANRMVTPCVCV